MGKQWGIGNGSYFSAPKTLLIKGVEGQLLFSSSDQFCHMYLHFAITVSLDRFFPSFGIPLKSLPGFFQLVPVLALARRLCTGETTTFHLSHPWAGPVLLGKHLIKEEHVPRLHLLPLPFRTSFYMPLGYQNALAHPPAMGCKLRFIPDLGRQRETI